MDCFKLQYNFLDKDKDGRQDKNSLGLDRTWTSFRSFQRFCPWCSWDQLAQGSLVWPPQHIWNIPKQSGTSWAHSETHLKYRSETSQNNWTHLGKVHFLQQIVRFATMHNAAAIDFVRVHFDLCQSVFLICVKSCFKQKYFHRWSAQNLKTITAVLGNKCTAFEPFAEQAPSDLLLSMLTFHTPRGVLGHDAHLIQNR